MLYWNSLLWVGSCRINISARTHVNGSSTWACSHDTESQRKQQRPRLELTDDHIYSILVIKASPLAKPSQNRDKIKQGQRSRFLTAICPLSLCRTPGGILGFSQDYIKHVNACVSVGRCWVEWGKSHYFLSCSCDIIHRVEIKSSVYFV